MCIVWTTVPLFSFILDFFIKLGCKKETSHVILRLGDLWSDGSSTLLVLNRFNGLFFKYYFFKVDDFC